MTKDATKSSLPPIKATTSYDEQTKNVKPNLGVDFDLADLTEEQLKEFEHLSKAYGLDPSSSLPVVDANMKLALQTVAAKMSLEQRQILGFQLKDLVSSCIIDGEPCDTVSDFKPTFDVDYGNCYTFNYDTPVKYITKRTGSSYGLRMTIFSNATETLPSSQQGVKIVLHRQDIAPFPNSEGYVGSVGEAVSLQVTYGKLSKLGSPYGGCSTLESVAKDQQPFYYNGSYSTEGCLRSCFQRKIATACGCADSRFPSPTDMNVPFCDPLEPTKYKCMEAYIAKNGDYYTAQSVGHCKCYDPCEDTAYRAEISESPWPVGGFFYGGFCPRAMILDSANCADFYGANGMRLDVSFSQLGYKKIEEEPTTSPWALFNDLAGNSGLWIGFTVATMVEGVLCGIQYILYVCGWTRLPEVPRADELENASDEESDGDESDNDDESDNNDDSESDNSDDDDDDAPAPSGAPSMSRIGPPKNFDNAIAETENTRRGVPAMMLTAQEVYDDNQQYEPVVPVIVQMGEHVGHFADV